jgi:F0F1-type ATP synthase assembly protein I
MSLPKQSDESVISYRWIENGHILLWLIKDTSWALEFKVGGLIMIAPTLAVALYILYRSRRQQQELVHNIAVCLWITANSLWMAGEFLHRELRPVASGIFMVGLLTLVVYYLFLLAKKLTKERS